MSGKRARSLSSVTKGLKKELRGDETKVFSGGRGIERDNGPVQQLVSMFGALVAQGEKAVSSLEILISSISADLLAEVVIANMQNLPSNCPPTEGDEELILDKETHTGLTGSNPEFSNLASLLTNILSQSTASPLEDTRMDSMPSAPNELEVLLYPQLIWSFLFFDDFFLPNIPTIRLFGKLHFDFSFGFFFLPYYYF